MTMNSHTRNTKKQHGAVLVVSLIMLLVMTLIGLSAMRSTVLEEKMAGNYRDSNIAFQAAEAVLLDSHSDLACTSGCTRSPSISGINNFDASCTAGLCDGWVSAVWNDAAKVLNAAEYGEYTGATDIEGVATKPGYLIEGKKCIAAGWASWKYCYRITGIGYGGTQNAQRLLQEVYILP